jgi:hypothetical protein
MMTVQQQANAAMGTRPTIRLVDGLVNIGNLQHRRTEERRANGWPPSGPTDEALHRLFMVVVEPLVAVAKSSYLLPPPTA